MKAKSSITQKLADYQMRIAYVNANYHKNHTGGGNVHMEQFISNAIALGHEVWVYPGDQYPGAQIIPTSRLAHIRTMRHMDAFYVRLENRSPKICKWSLPPRRSLYGFPVVAWEFNTLPDELLPTELVEKDSLESNQILKEYSRGCDLAVCVSPALAEKITKNLNSRRVLTVSNGSDPALFKPDAPVVQRLSAFKDNFNVVWIGTLKEPWHDLDMLGAAAHQLWEIEKNKNIIFHILGAGLSGIMADMPPNVYYWGAEMYDRLPNWLAGMDVGLSLYRPGRASFNSPLKVFDYLASSLGIVSTQHPLVGNILSQLGCSDLMVPHGDSRALADILVNLANNKERVHQLGVAGRQLIIDKYNWRRAVKDTMDEIESILKEKGKIPQP